jgi:hypothetical protein
VLQSGRESAIDGKLLGDSTQGFDQHAPRLVARQSTLARLCLEGVEQVADERRQAACTDEHCLGKRVHTVQ